MGEKNKPDVTPVDEEIKEQKTGRRSSGKAASEKKASTKTAKEVVSDDDAEVVDQAAKTQIDANEQKQAPKKTSRRGANVKALELEIEKQKELAQEANDKYKRLLAEFENARAREAKEATRMYDVGAKEVLEKLLPVVDNFERAIDAIPEDQKDGATEQGVSMIYKQLMTALEELGVAPMNAEGTQFDPNLHNAVLHVEDDAYDENVVAEEMQKGYMYKDSVLRHSMVKVAN